MHRLVRIHLPLLLAALFAVAMTGGGALAKPVEGNPSLFGPDVDAFCSGPQGNGTRPWADYSGPPATVSSDVQCGLCHGPTSLQKQPEYDWYRDGRGDRNTRADDDFSPFCPPTPNTPPVANDDSVSTNEDTTVTIDVLANDTDADVGDALRVGSVTQGANGSVTNNGANLTYTPNADFNGSDSFSYTASDGKGGSDTAIVNVTVRPVNDPPAVMNPGDQAGFEGQSVSVQIAATDPDSGTTLSYSASGLPPNLAIAPASGLISGTLATGSSDNSPYSVTVTVDDAGTPARSSSIDFTWAVSANNAPPAITSAPVTTATVGRPYSYQITAEDEGPLTYSLDTAPAGMTIAKTGLIQWTPGDSQSGTNLVTVNVSDDGGESASQTFTVTVQAAPVSTACTDADEDGFSPDGGICGPVDSNDDELIINPGLAEVCGDGIDNDSDGAVDGDDSECNGGDCLANLLDDDGTGGAPIDFRLKKAEWNAEKRRLRVDGDRAPEGTTVTVYNANPDLAAPPLGTTRSGNEEKWRFEKYELEIVPCRVRVEIAGQSAERAVEDAPVDCDTGQPDGGALTGVEVEAEWESERSRLKAKGEKFPLGSTVQLFDGDTGVRLGEARDRGEGKWRFDVTLDPSEVPCRLRVELEGKSLTEPVSGAPGCR